MKTFWSGVNIFSPGNFVAVHLSEVDGDYEIENKDEFLEKFFDIKRMPLLTPMGIIKDSPFAMPTIEAKPEYANVFNRKAQFLIEKPGRAKVYRIVLDKIRIVEEKYKELQV